MEEGLGFEVRHEVLRVPPYFFVKMSLASLLLAFVYFKPWHFFFSTLPSTVCYADRHEHAITFPAGMYTSIATANAICKMADEGDVQSYDGFANEHAHDDDDDEGDKAGSSGRCGGGTSNDAADGGDDDDTRCSLINIVSLHP